MKDVVDALARAEPGAVSTKPFFLRKQNPSFYASIKLQNGPTTRPCHNRLHVLFDSPWEKREDELPHLVSNILAPKFPDYAYVADASEHDEDRFGKFLRPLAPAEILLELPAPPFLVEYPRGRQGGVAIHWFHPSPNFMVGPHGFLWDIVWFNYFGRPYVELMGEQRLRAAGWARVEQVGDGLGCYATERIDDPNSFDRRARIRDALAEFVWSPGCNREDKEAPVFDFSEQLAAAPQAGTPSLPPGARLVEFAALTEQEKSQAIEAFEKQTGMVYDANTGTMLPKKG